MRRRWWLPLAIGLVLRALFLVRWPLVAGDGLVYGNLAQTWLQHGVFGIAGANGIHVTLIRLPGYPMFLAACFFIFGVHYGPVLWVQALVDLATCVLLAKLAREEISERAATVTLWLAALCPFTANYCAAPLTETLSIFCVAAAMFWAARFARRRELRSAVWLGLACGYAILLRPDGVLLPVAVAIGLGWKLQDRLLEGALLRGAAVVLLIPALFVSAWTWRNWRTFHVLQPLAPRYANDPGELPEAGYKAWTATWFGDAVSNEDFYWNADDGDLDITMLPVRVFDSSAEYAKTAQLIADYNSEDAMTPELDARFASLARERRAAHPLKTRVVLPLARLADMWLRPRTELLNVPMRWWDFRAHARQSWFALAYGAVNAALLVCALLGALRCRLPLGALLLSYVALRCALLLTLENAEPRYTLECFPIVLLAAGAWLATCGRRSSSSPS